MTDSNTILLKVERLKELLVLRATNKPLDEQEYTDLRHQLMAVQGLRGALPEVVRRCGTIREFWDFIKDRFDAGEKHRRRVEYLREQFAPMVEALEDGTPADGVGVMAGAARRGPASEAGRAAGMLKVLLLSANPADAPLAIDEEFRAIDAKIRASDHRDYVDLIKHGAVRLEDLPGLLMRHKPHVVHFSGHGDKVAIELTSSDGRGHLVPPSALADIFRVLKDNVRVVLLNACDSAPQAEAIVSVIDCAVGMSDEIEDGAAIAFAAAFYEALGYGKSIQDAFDLALVQLAGAGADRALAKLHKRRGVRPADIILVTPRPQ